MLLATWNIREFEANSGKGGPRLEESYYYIAELIDHFDLVAVQEVRHDLSAIRRVMGLLGHHWDFFVTDTNKESPGNDERIVVLYDTRKVNPTGIVGEFVLPRQAKTLPLARSPLLATFQAGWTTFTLVVVHILWGDEVENLDRAHRRGQAPCPVAREAGRGSGRGEGGRRSARRVRKRPVAG